MSKYLPLNIRRNVNVTCEKRVSGRIPLDKGVKRLVNWKDGFRNPKPLSVVQGILLGAMDSGKPRSHYDLKAWTLQLIHKSRMTKKFKRSDRKRKKDNVMTIAGLNKVTDRKMSSPHFVVTTTSSSGSDLGIIENKFYWQFSGKKSRLIAIADLEPNGTDSDFRILYSIQTGSPGKFWQDFDGYYPPGSCSSGDGKLIHPALALIPKEGNMLRMYDMDKGCKDAQVIFKKETVLEDVICHESKMITLQFKKSILSKDLLCEFLIFDYPPLEELAHVQVQNSCTKEDPNAKRAKLAESGSIFEDLLVISYSSGQKMLYDLETVLKKVTFTDYYINASSALEEETSQGVTHRVTQLQNPLLTLHSDQLHPPHHLFLVVEVKQGLQVQEITPKGLVPLSSEDGGINCFSEDSKISFMKTAPVQIIVNVESTIKVFRVYLKENKEASNDSNYYLKKLLDMSFLVVEDDQKPVESASPNTPRRPTRNIKRKSYASDLNVSVDFDENQFLNQLAIVRFAEDGLVFYIYDSLTFNVEYIVKVEHFRPKSEEVFGGLDVYFNNHFIAVRSKSSAISSLYILNLLADCHEINKSNEEGT